MSNDQPESPDWHASFASTAWTLIYRVQALPASRRAEALDGLLSRYWRPIYAFYRSLGLPPHDAEDLVQSLLQRFVVQEGILRVAEERGRFRDWLVACARRHFFDWRRRNLAAKRHPAEGLISLDAAVAVDGVPLEPAVAADADRALREAWRRDLLDHAIRAVEVDCARLDRLDDWQLFLDYHLSEPSARPTWKQLAGRHRLRDWQEAVHRAEWVKRRLRRALREEIGRYVHGEAAIDEEILDLFW